MRFNPLKSLRSPKPRSPTTSSPVQQEEEHQEPSSPAIVQANTWKVQRAIEYFEQKANQNGAFDLNGNRFSSRLSLPDSLHLITLEPLNLSPASARHRQPSSNYNYATDSLANSPSSYYDADNGLADDADNGLADDEEWRDEMEQALADAEEAMEHELQETLLAAQSPNAAGAAQRHARLLAAEWLNRHDDRTTRSRICTLEALNLSPGGNSVGGGGRSIANSSLYTTKSTVFHNLSEAVKFTRNSTFESFPGEEDYSLAGSKGAAPSVFSRNTAMTEAGGNCPSIVSDLRRLQASQETVRQELVRADESWRCGEDSMSLVGLNKNLIIHHYKTNHEDDEVPGLVQVASEATTNSSSAQSSLGAGGGSRDSDDTHDETAAAFEVPNADPTTCSGFYMMGWMRIFIIKRKLQKEKRERMAKAKACLGMTSPSLSSRLTSSVKKQQQRRSNRLSFGRRRKQGSKNDDNKNEPFEVEAL